MGGPLSRQSLCFGAKPNEGLGLEISDETGSGGGKASPREAWRVGKGTQRGWVGEERSREAVENGQQKGPVKMSKQSWVDNGQQKEAVRETSQDELAFQVAL